MRARQGESLAGRQRCPSRGGIGRKPQAKRWSDEQKSHRRQFIGMRRQLSSKSSTCTERCAVNAADISVKVNQSYPGRSPVPLEQTGHTASTELRSSRGGWKGQEKSAESIVECSTHSKARTGGTETETGISMTRMDAEATDTTPSATWEDTRRNRGRSEVVR